VCLLVGVYISVAADECARRAAAAVVASGVAIVCLLAVVSQTSPSARVLLSPDGGMCICLRVCVYGCV
jgi:hypothetical protein